MRRQSRATHRYCSALLVTAIARRIENNALADLGVQMDPNLRFRPHIEDKLTSACRPTIAYSRVGTGRTPSAVPSSSNFPACHLGLEPILIAQSYRSSSSPPFGPLREKRQSYQH
jgi:hypothetical protein